MIVFLRAGLAATLCSMTINVHAQVKGLDVDALSLQVEPEGTKSDISHSMFIEGAIGRIMQRYGLPGDTISRLTFDYKQSSKLGSSTRAALSARVDATDPKDRRIAGAILSLREAYVGWHDEGAQHIVEFGRINLRDGPGYGYNPTDYFRDDALRTVTSANPYSLRENRMGSVMVRAQRALSGSTLSMALSPRLESAPSDRGVSLDIGATNRRNRGLMSFGQRLSETANLQLLAYKEANAQAKVGVNLTALATQAVVVHGEWSYGREADLLSRALSTSGPERGGSRVATGVTYTTSTRMSLTAEYQYNGFALDQDAWRALAHASPPASLSYVSRAFALQDIASRQAWLVYVTQPNIGMKNLDLTLLYKRNGTDSSRLFWLELRRKLEKFDVGVQFQRNLGVVGSEFGSNPIRSSAGVVAAVYF